MVFIIKFCVSVYFIKILFFSNMLNVCSIFVNLFFLWCLSGSVFFKLNKMVKNISVLIIVSILNIFCYDIIVSSCLLVIGVKIGVNLFMSISIEKNFVKFEFENKFCMFVFEIIIFVVFVIFWINCKMIKI